MDEPFDELMGPPPKKMTENRGHHSFSEGGTSKSSGPPPSAFGGASMSTTGAPPPSNAFTHSIPGRWNQYESDVDTHRAETNLAERVTPSNSTALVVSEDPNRPRPYYDYQPRRSETQQQHHHQQQDAIPRPAYEFRRTASEGVGSTAPRQYKWQDDDPTLRTRAAPLTSSKIRTDAMKVLGMVESQYESQHQGYAVRRTESGNIVRESNNLEEPYCVRRTASGTIESGVGAETKRRVPAALSGLNLGGSGRPSQRTGGRITFHDSKYRDDDLMDDEQDEIIAHATDHDMDGDLVDVVAMGNRAGASNNSNWSSRYQVDSTLLAMSGGLSGKEILEDIERENQRERTSARNMIASSAYTIKSKVAENKGKVFGSGFTFRQNNVFGKMDDDDLNGTNLRTKWQDMDAGTPGSVLPPPPPVHKTWQQALLSKRRRRRMLLVSVLGVVGLIVVLVTALGLKKNSGGLAVRSSGNSPGVSVTFYVTSDVPFDGDNEDKLVKDLKNLPGDAEFIIHLGNIQDATSTLCPKTRYKDVASVLSKSPVPLLAIPGEHDWMRCPKPDEALQEWTLQFGQFEGNFESNKLLVRRQRDRVENFSMLHNGVLFIGLHLVTGPIHNQEEHDALIEDNLKFFYGMLNLNKGEFRSVVIFGNARPGPQQDAFFLGVMDSVESLSLPVAYIHANPGTGAVEEYTPFVEHDSILGVQIEDGGRNPPLRVNVGFGNRPFILG